MIIKVFDIYKNILVMTKQKPSPRQRVAYVKTVTSGLLFLIFISKFLGNARPPSEKFTIQLQKFTSQLTKIRNSIHTVNSKHINQFQSLTRKILRSIRNKLDSIRSEYYPEAESEAEEAAESESEAEGSDDEYGDAWDDGNPPH
jgi:hypothetical protein